MDRQTTDYPDIRRIAAEHIRMQGPAAVAWLTEQAELAAAKGDTESARTWREIAAAAVLILKSQSEPLD